MPKFRCRVCRALNPTNAQACSECGLIPAAFLPEQTVREVEPSPANKLREVRLQFLKAGAHRILDDLSPSRLAELHCSACETLLGELRAEVDGWIE